MWSAWFNKYAVLRFHLLQQDNSVKFKPPRSQINHRDVNVFISWHVLRMSTRSKAVQIFFSVALFGSVNSVHIYRQIRYADSYIYSTINPASISQIKIKYLSSCNNLVFAFCANSCQIVTDILARGEFPLII